jgi:hypothetical protein
MGILDAPVIPKDSKGRRLDSFSVADTGAIFHPLDIATLSDSLMSYGEGIPTYVEMLTAQKIRFDAPDGGARRVFSYPGQTAAIVHSHISDVTGLTRKPNACIIQAGTNDVIGGTGLASLQTALAQVEAMCAELEAVGVRPIMTTIPPVGGPYQYNGKQQLSRQFNLMLKRSALKYRRLILDPYSVLIDPLTSRYQAVYDSGDNVHPSTVGIIAWAQHIATALSPLLTPTPIKVLETINDTVNGLYGTGRLTSGNGLWGGATNAGVAAGFSYNTPPAGYTPSLVAGDDNFNWQRITAAAVNSSSSLLGYQAVGATVAPGDIIQAAVRIRTGQQVTTSTKFQVFMNTLTNSGAVQRGNFPLTGPVGVSGQINDTVVLRTFQVPALADRCSLQFIIPATDGTYDIAQPTIYNLTALGAA